MELMAWLIFPEVLKILEKQGISEQKFYQMENDCPYNKDAEMNKNHSIECKKCPIGKAMDEVINKHKKHK